MARKFNRSRTTGKFMSEKMSPAATYWESTIERDYFFLLDFDRTVNWFRDHPFKIYYKLNGKKRHYTSDVLVSRGNRIQLVEVKDARELDSDDNKKAFQVGKQFCQERGYEYVVVTDAEIRAGYLLENVKLLTRYRKQSVTGSCWGEVKRALRSGWMEIQKLKGILDSFLVVNSLPYIYSCLYHGALKVESIKESPIELCSIVMLSL